MAFSCFKWFLLHKNDGLFLHGPCTWSYSVDSKYKYVLVSNIYSTYGLFMTYPAQKDPTEKKFPPTLVVSTRSIVGIIQSTNATLYVPSQSREFCMKLYPAEYCNRIVIEERETVYH